MRCSDQLVRVGCCFAFRAASVGANAERGALEQSGYSKFRVDITTHSVAAAGTCLFLFFFNTLLLPSMYGGIIEMY